MEDLEKTYEWRNDLDLIKLTQGLRFPKTSEMNKAWFENVLNDMSNRNIYFGIDKIETGEFIGIIQLTNIDYISGTVVWGMIFGDKSNQGKGFGKEARVLILNYVFNILNLRKILMYIVNYNIGPQILASDEFGFKNEGLLKEQFFFKDKYHDVIIISILKADYLKNID